MASKRQLELMDQIGRLDAYLTEGRARIDAQAWGRLFRDLAATAEELAKRAKVAAELAAELDGILEAEWAARGA
jgi:hypothetical protein